MSISISFFPGSSGPGSDADTVVMMMRKLRIPGGRAVRIVVLVAFAVAIMVLSLIPDPPFSVGWVSGMDKIQHWIAYTVLGILVFLAVSSPGRHRTLTVAVTIFACTMYGGLIEALQSFTGRTPDPIDFFVNMFGAAVGSIAALGLIEASLDTRRRGSPDDDHGVT